MIRHCLSFSQLSTMQLYQILALRSEVFVVEQQCVYQDVDGKDLQCLHLLYYDTTQQSNLVGYARLLPPGLSYPTASIGRVVIHGSCRQSNHGRVLVNDAIELCQHYWSEQDITIGAQCYLLKFYQSLGFEVIGDEYLEDGIAHIDMQYIRNT